MYIKGKGSPKNHMDGMSCLHGARSPLKKGGKQSYGECKEGEKQKKGAWVGGTHSYAHSAMVFS